jgi:ABC-type nitrate/sulfonate/bicarbonate transport system substrate-binding protein
LGTVTGDELTPLLYAQGSGLYRKAGLDVQMVLAPSGAQVAAGGVYDARVPYEQLVVTSCGRS